VEIGLFSVEIGLFSVEICLHEGFMISMEEDGEDRTLLDRNRSLVGGVRFLFCGDRSLLCMDTSLCATAAAHGGKWVSFVCWLVISVYS